MKENNAICPVCRSEVNVKGGCVNPDCWFNTGYYFEVATTLKCARTLLQDAANSPIVTVHPNLYAATSASTDLMRRIETILTYEEAKFWTFGPTLTPIDDGHSREQCICPFCNEDLEPVTIDAKDCAKYYPNITSDPCSPYEHVLYRCTVCNKVATLADWKFYIENDVTLPIAEQEHYITASAQLKNIRTQLELFNGEYIACTHNDVQQATNELIEKFTDLIDIIGSHRDNGI